MGKNREEAVFNVYERIFTDSGDAAAGVASLPSTPQPQLVQVPGYWRSPPVRHKINTWPKFSSANKRKILRLSIVAVVPDSPTQNTKRIGVLFRETRDFTGPDAAQLAFPIAFHATAC